MFRCGILNFQTFSSEECLIVEDLIGLSMNAFDSIQPQDTIQPQDSDVEPGVEPKMQEKMRRLGATASYLYNLKHHQAMFDMIEPQDSDVNPEIQKKMRRLGSAASYLYNLHHQEAEEELRPVSLTSSYLDDLGVSKRESDAMDAAFEDAKTLSNQS